MQNKHTETVLDSVAALHTFLPYPPDPTHLFIPSAASVLASISLMASVTPVYSHLLQVLCTIRLPVLLIFRRVKTDLDMGDSSCVGVGMTQLLGNSEMGVKQRRWGVGGGSPNQYQISDQMSCCCPVQALSTPLSQ